MIQLLVKLIFVLNNPLKIRLHQGQYHLIYNTHGTRISPKLRQMHLPSYLLYLTFIATIHAENHVPRRSLKHDKVNGITFTVVTKSLMFDFFFFFLLSFCFECWPNSPMVMYVLRNPDAVFGTACKPNTHLSIIAHSPSSLSKTGTPKFDFRYISAQPHPSNFRSSLQMRVGMKNLDSLFDAFS